MNRAAPRATPDRSKGRDAVGPNLLSIEQVAEILNVGTRFVRRLVAERRIAFHKVGRYVRFDRADVDAWIEAGRVDQDDNGQRRQ